MSKTLITRIILLSLILVLAGCGNNDSSLTGTNATAAAVTRIVTPQQKTFLSSNPKLTVNWNSSEGVPYSLRGFNKGVTGETVSAALNFLDEIKLVFKMKDPASEMRLRRIQKDTLGSEHIRFDQMYNGLRVVGGELIVHINNEKKIYQVNGQYYPDITIATSAGIKPDAAIAEILSELRNKPVLKTEKAPELVIYPSGIKQFVLAYHYVLSYNDMAGGVGRAVYYLNAGSGDVIRKYNDIKHFRAPGDNSFGAGKGFLRTSGIYPSSRQLQNSLLSIPLPTGNGYNQNMTGFILSGEGGGDVSVQGWADTTNNADYLYNKTLFWYIYNSATTGSYTDLDTYAFRIGHGYAWGATDRTEMSAARNMNLVQDYFKTVHSRNSFDNANAYARVNVHYGTDYVNAYWDGSEFTFGDGDGIEANSLAVLDVVAHEYAHGWTDNSSTLIYEEESGALNESFSDIIGANVEFYGQPDGRSYYPGRRAGYADWLCGEDSWLLSTALRDLRNPSDALTVGQGGEQPSRYHGTYWYTGRNDNGGVHYNSGPQNFAYYLLSDGGSGTNDGLPYNVTGIDATPTVNSRLVAYRTNSYYLTASAGYALARDAWISAAEDLNAAWVEPVKAAWDAIGVIELPSPVRESFESASLPDGWTTGGDADWARSSTTAKAGSYSLKAGTISDSQSTSVQRTITPSTAGYLSFFVNVSSEPGYDFLDFYVDGIRKTRWSGTSVPWTPYVTYLAAGSHLLKWVYVKDESNISGSDTAYIDALTYVPEAPTSLISTVTSSRAITLTWTDNASGGATFKIERKEGSGGTYGEIATVGANTTRYNDTGLRGGRTYYYRVRGYNASGNSSYSNEGNATIPGSVDGGGPCFIATAAFGSPMEKHVQILRDFRDRILLNSSAGKAFVQFYYRTSPPIADKIAKSSPLRFLTRIALMPVIGVAYLIVNYGVVATLLLITFIVLTLVFSVSATRRRLRFEGDRDRENKGVLIT
ncbi:MAG: M4 family metallopeptidase [Deltaproteobacteria bacterium]